MMKKRSWNKKSKINPKIPRNKIKTNFIKVSIAISTMALSMVIVSLFRKTVANIKGITKMVKRMDTGKCLMIMETIIIETFIKGNG